MPMSIRPISRYLYLDLVGMHLPTTISIYLDLVGSKPRLDEFDIPTHNSDRSIPFRPRYIRKFNVPRVVTFFHNHNEKNY